MIEVPFFDLGTAVQARRAELHHTLDSVIDAGYLVGGGAVVEFEQQFARFVGSRNCVSVGNGLDALRIGLEALGVKPGDEVIVPGFTFYATWLAVMQVGAIPVPVDVTLDSGSLNIGEVTAAITSRTRAILVVHLFGIPAELSAFRELADRHDLWLIEDAAQSHGAISRGEMTGSIGDFAAFSFYPTKNLGALGDAGALVTSSRNLAEVARSRRSYGQGATKYDHVDTGWNSRLDTLQAAFLSSALPRLNGENARRRVIAGVYVDAVGNHSPSVIGSNNVESSVWHHFVLRVADREAAREYFSDRGVGTDIHYPYYFDSLQPMAAYPHGSSLPNSAKLSKQVLSLPIAPWLTDDQVNVVAAALVSFPSELFAE